MFLFVIHNLFVSFIKNIHYNMLNIHNVVLKSVESSEDLVNSAERQISADMELNNLKMMLPVR